MKNTVTKLLAHAGVVAGIALGTPVVALAEESAVGPDILIPKMAEFIPALIAFLVILLILAKLVWPPSSQRLLWGLSAWPLTQWRRTVWRSHSARSRSHRSGLRAGFLSDLIHPRALQPLAQPFCRASMTYLESE